VTGLRPGVRARRHGEICSGGGGGGGGGGGVADRAGGGVGEGSAGVDGGCGMRMRARQNVRHAVFDAYTTNIISSRDYRYLRSLVAK
jgi:hypothetical protein